jgi:hypothetical protein
VSFNLCVVKTILTATLNKRATVIFKIGNVWPVCLGLIASKLIRRNEPVSIELRKLIKLTYRSMADRRLGPQLGDFREINYHKNDKVGYARLSATSTWPSG